MRLVLVAPILAMGTLGAAAAETVAACSAKHGAEQDACYAAVTFPDAKDVDLADLAFGTRKYFDRHLQIRGISCYYADVDDFRCLRAGPGAVIFTTRINPPAMRKLIEDECDQIRKALLSEKCKVTLRFSYTEDDVTKDTIDNNRSRTVIQPDVVEVVAPAGSGRRRR